MLRTAQPFTTAARRGTALRSGPTSPRARLISTSAVGTPRLLASKATTSPRRNVHVLAVSPAVVCRTLYSTKQDPPVLPNKPDIKREKELGKEKLDADPAHVSVDSSYRQDTGDVKQGQRDVSEGVAADVASVKEALSLAEVPREAYALGLAGTIPYFATSLSTIYLTWNLRTQWPTDSNILNSIMLSHENASQLLSHLEVLQVGYGAAIISFLGAIHWGLEWAEKSSKEPRTRYRYAVGVLAPALAWPTVMLPAQFALTSQFALFTALYFVDSRFTTRGWTPRWYGVYRFVLTAIVGGAIFISLVFRSKSGKEGSRLDQTSLVDTMHSHDNPGQAQAYSAKWAKLEDEERARIKKEKEEEEKRKKEEEEEGKEKEEKKNKGKGKGEKDEKKKGDDAKKSGQDEKDEEGGDDAKEGENKDGSDDSGDEGQDKGDDSKKGDGDDKEEDADDKKDDGGEDGSTKGPGDKDSKKKDAKGDEEEGKGKKGKK